MSPLSESQIDQYLLGQLQGEDLLRFRQRLADDQDFALAVEERRILSQQVNAYGDHQLKERLRFIRKQEMERRERKSSRRLWYIAAAFAALLLVALMSWWIIDSSQSAAAPQFADFYHSYPLNFSARTDATDSLLHLANDAYHAKDFQKALPLFETLLAKDTSQSKIQLALGICLIEDDRHAEAQALFQQILQRNFDPFSEQAKWYSALLYWRQDNRPKAKELLEEIANQTQSPFNAQAKALLERIK